MTAKSLQQIAGTAMQQVGAAEVCEVEISQDNPVVQIISDTLERLKACKPAWKNSLSSNREVMAWKREWTVAIARAGVVSQEQLERGIVMAQRDTKPFMPSVGQFIEWCLGVGVSDEHITSAFQRMINRQEPADDIEYATRLEVQFACRNQLPADKALALFKSAFVRITAQVQRGERIPSMSTPLLENAAPSSRDFIEQKISERMASSNRPLTPIEQRMTALRQQQRSKGRGESFKYRRSNAG